MDIEQCMEYLKCCAEFEETMAQKIITEAKELALDYADVKAGIEAIAKEVRYNAADWEKYKHVFDTAKRLLDREMDGLRPINRPEQREYLCRDDQGHVQRVCKL